MNAMCAYDLRTDATDTDAILERIRAVPTAYRIGFTIGVLHDPTRELRLVRVVAVHEGTEPVSYDFVAEVKRILVSLGLY